MKIIDMKKITFLLLLISGSFVRAQDNIGIAYNEISLDYGIGLTKVKENRYYNGSRHTRLHNFGMAYTIQKERARTTIEMSFATNFDRGSKLTWYQIIKPDFTLNHQRKVGEHWVGAYMQTATILNFPVTRVGSFGNNPLSYTIAQNLGVSYRKNFDLPLIEDTSWQGYVDARSSLLNYVIRPAYGHPYPEHFLDEKHFTPTRRGIGTSIAKSGKIRTVDKYQSIHVVLGIRYFINDNMAFGLRYKFDYQGQVSDQSSSLSQHALNLRVSYIY